MGERITEDNIMMNRNRREIFEYIQARPGVCGAEITRNCGLEYSMVFRHLWRLEKFGFVRSVKCKDHNEYYPRKS